MNEIDMTALDATVAGAAGSNVGVSVSDAGAAGSDAAAADSDAGTPNSDARRTPSPDVLVWDLATRLFHWMLALSFAGAFLTADSERQRDIHVLLGYAFAGLIAFRLVWGFAGSRYSRFRSFLFRPAEIGRYLRSLLTGHPRHYLGHNPAGSVAIFLLLGLGIVTAAAGLATYNGIGGDWTEELHEGAANAMLAVVVVHVAGVVISSLLHRENLIRSMITGRKARR